MVIRVVLPSSWRRGRDDHHDNVSIYDEEGEIMVGMNTDQARREASEGQRSTAAGTEGRLSRDLEEGFMDDSDDDGETGSSRMHRG